MRLEERVWCLMLVALWGVACADPADVNIIVDEGLCMGDRCEVQPTPCEDDGECGEQERCLEGFCSPEDDDDAADVPGCPEECPEATECVDNACIPKDGMCSEAISCPDQEVCLEGVCVPQAECSAYCEGTGRVCSRAGQCVSGVDCAADAECPIAMVCVEELCVEQACDEEAACEEGAECAGGLCRVIRAE